MPPFYWGKSTIIYYPELVTSMSLGQHKTIQTLKRKLRQKDELLRLIEQKAQENKYDNRFSRYGINRKIRLG